MAGSTQKTVHEIFQSMEHGPVASPSYATAQVESATLTKLTTEEVIIIKRKRK